LTEAVGVLAVDYILALTRTANGHHHIIFRYAISCSIIVGGKTVGIFLPSSQLSVKNIQPLSGEKESQLLRTAIDWVNL
jgi:hypothetical protein